MQLRSLKEGLKLHAHAIKSAGFFPPIVAINQHIDLYSKHGLTNDAHKLFEEMPQQNVFSWNTLLNAYIKSKNLTKAKAVFDSSPCKDSVTYNSMIAGYARSDGYEINAIEIFILMQSHDGNDAVRIDEFTMTTMLNLVAKIRVLVYGRQIHSFMVKTGNNLSGFSLSSLIDMYSKCGSFEDACRVVKDGYGGDSVVKNALVAACCREGEMGMAREVFMSDPELNDIVSWNTLISGYVQNECNEEAVELCACAVEEQLHWNEHTFAGFLAACGGLRSLNLGKEAHARVLRERMHSNSFVSSGIIDVYAKCADMRYAERAYRMGGWGNVFATTSMIVGYSAKGNMSEARRLFDSLLEKNFVVWTTIISGYVKLQRCEEAFALFCEYAATSHPDTVILVSLLSACATSTNVSLGKEIHAHMLKMGMLLDEKAASTLIDMYSKTGFISYAFRVFQRVTSWDTVLYNVMIAGCAHYGYEDEAIHLFNEMVELGLKPDAVTFIALLSVCRHCGLVEKGEGYFSSMSRDYGIVPEMDHYACMVDLYGRSNQLEKAAAFLAKMPVEPDSVVLSAFLNGCRASKNLEVARMVESKLLGSKGGDAHGGRYVQVARAYACGGMWEEMGRVMREMRGKEVIKKVAGCSWAHVGGVVHTFISGDRSHAEAEMIYQMLDSLIDNLTERDENHSGSLCEKEYGLFSELSCIF